MQTIRNSAPTTMDAGSAYLLSFPMKRFTMCGPISPTNPIMPTCATTTETTTAHSVMQKRRVRRMFIPRLRATSSPASMLFRLHLR